MQLRLRLALALVVAALGTAIAPGSASADVACGFNDTTDDLVINQAGPVSTITVRVVGGVIKVDDNGTLGAGFCQDRATSDVDLIALNPGGGVVIYRIEEADDFVRSGTDEIKFQAPQGTSILVGPVMIDGDGAADTLRLGADGLNYNAPSGDTDVDVTTTGGSFEFRGGPGNDLFSASGGFGTGAPAPGVVRFDGGAGDDDLEGGAGTDSVSYAGATRGVNVDLASTARQDGGSLGRDRLVSIESVSGTEFADVFRGTSGRNVFSGSVGDDFADGRGGDDSLFGDEGDDTLSFQGAPGPVTVDLENQNQQDTGVGLLTAEKFVNVIGSRFADDLKGTSAPNRMEGGGGNDKITALGGEDTVLARDGAKDTVDCGEDDDTGVFDVRGVDTITACETASFAVPTPPRTPDTSVRLLVSSADRQRIGSRGVLVTLECPDEACTVQAGASLKEPKAKKKRKKARSSKTLKLKGSSVKLKAGEPRKLRLKLSKKGLKRTVKALRKKAKRTVAIRALATDAAGNRDTETDKVKLKAPPKPKKKTKRG